MNDLKLIGSIFLLFGVFFGALASHYLKALLPLDSLNSMQVGVRYLMYHGLALLFLPTLKMLAPKDIKRISKFIAVGTLLFSGSIFLLATQTLHGVELSFVGPVTPIGGLLLISAWAMLSYALFQRKSS